MEFDCSALDRPEVLNLLFHPRPEPAASTSVHERRHDVWIPVDPSVGVGGRLHLYDPSFANVLFFHGNGEIVADYDDMAPVYGRVGVNFCPVDYRGYGRSNGVPSCSTLMRDAHAVMDFVSGYLAERGYTGPMVVMGRSLGSAPAVELAAARGPSAVRGLVIESGFAHSVPLLRRLGIDVEGLGLSGKDVVGNYVKMRRVVQPTLIIHAELDRIIPFSDALELYDACGAADKRLVRIADAGHNDILNRGMTQILAAVKSLTDRLRESP